MVLATALLSFTIVVVSVWATRAEVEKDKKMLLMNKVTQNFLGIFLHIK
jgi:hypothetical protein